MNHDNQLITISFYYSDIDAGVGVCPTRLFAATE